MPLSVLNKAALCVCPPALLATTAMTVPPVKRAVHHATAPRHARATPAALTRPAAALPAGAVTPDVVCAPVAGNAPSAVPLVSYAAPIPAEPLPATTSDGSPAVPFGAPDALGPLGGGLPPVGGGLIGPGVPGAVPTATPTPDATPSPTPTASATPTPAPTATATPTPVVTPTSGVTPTPEAVPTPVPTATPVTPLPPTTPDNPGPNVPPVGGVPEPSMWMLMIGGFGALGMRLRRRRARRDVPAPTLASYRVRRGGAGLAGLGGLWSGASAVEAGDLAATVAAKSTVAGAAGKLMLCVCPVALATGAVVAVPPLRNAVHAATVTPGSVGGVGAPLAAAIPPPCPEPLVSEPIPTTAAPANAPASAAPLAAAEQGRVASRATAIPPRG